MANNTTTLRDKMFFCYNKRVKQHLYFECEIDSEFSEKKKKTKREFWVYFKTEELDKALAGYRK